VPPTEPETTWHAHYRSRLGATVERRTRDDDPDDPVYYVVMHDPEANEFCVG
jgi:Glyoxalase-like domain